MRPCLPLVPTHLSAYVRLLAQELDDIFDERGWWLALWMGNQPKGFRWGSHDFYLKIRIL